MLLKCLYVICFQSFFAYMKNYLVLILIGLFTCISCKTDEIAVTCETELFGVPNESTGLSDDECKPVCTCMNYNPRIFSQAEIEELKA